MAAEITIEEVYAFPLLYWGGSAGTNPNESIDKDARDCHFALLDRTAAEQEALWAAQRPGAPAGTPTKYKHWREGPLWAYQSCSSGNIGHGTCEKAANLQYGDENGVLHCRTREEYQQWVSDNRDRPVLWTMGGTGVTPYYRYGISDDPPPPVDDEEEEEPGESQCVWGINWKPYGAVEFGEAMVFEYEVTGTFPPEVTEAMTFRIFFDGSQELRTNPDLTGMILIDKVNKRVTVEFLDVQQHELTVEATQIGCVLPVKLATIRMRANEDIPPSIVCIETLGRESITICEEADYSVELTICDEVFTSPPLHVIPPPQRFPPPEIITHPKSQTSVPGDYLQLYVVARYATNYQWEKRIDGVWTDISGQTGTNYSVEDVTPADQGDYRVRVWNPYGTVYSDVANVSFNCDRWIPTLTLTSTDWYTVTEGTEEKTVVGPDTVIHGIAGIDTASETIYWRVDGDIIPEGPGTSPGLTFSRTGMDLTVTVTDSYFHTVALEVTSAACEMTKQAEIIFYGVQTSHFGFAPNPIEVTFTKEIAQLTDPSIFVDVRNISGYPQSSLALNSAFGRVSGTGAITGVTPQFTALAKGGTGVVKITLSPDGVAALLAGHTSPDEHWYATWQDQPALIAFGSQFGFGNLDVLVKFKGGSTTLPVTLRWGHSQKGSLTEAEIEALAFSRDQVGISGEIVFAEQTGGYYAYIAIPKGGAVPRPKDGMVFVDSDMPFVEAKSSLGYPEVTAPNGWNYITVGEWMLFRSYYELNNPGAIRITAS